MTASNVTPVNLNRSFIISLGIISALWLLLVHEAFYSAAVIWVGNEIFNHCLLVIPASLYLIWEKRKAIAWHEAKSSYLAAICLFGQLLLFLLGVAGDIQLFQHAAVFSMLPTLAWFFLGDKIAWQLQFPLLFILFAIPVGEQLVPWLQEVTADMSVYMLQLTGIPLFRSGLFIEIPQGKFLVAEACSGISFLIASVVIGNLYAYMNLKTTWRRVMFVLLSVAVPILANAVRVYGLILVGYYSDMQHAVGADHLIYGWFFFAIVIVMLLAVGELVRSRERKALAKLDVASVSDTPTVTDEAVNKSESAATSNLNLNFTLTITLSVLLVLSMWQAYRMTHLQPVPNAYPAFVIDLPEATPSGRQLPWIPSFNNASAEYQQAHSLNGQDFEVYYAYFDGSDGELISGLHRLYSQDRWTLKQREQVMVQGKPMTKDLVASSIGTTRHMYYFYLVDGKWLVSPNKAKLQQVLQTLQGVQSQGAIVAVSVAQSADEVVDTTQILEFVSASVLSFIQAH